VSRGSRPRVGCFAARWRAPRIQLSRIGADTGADFRTVRRGTDRARGGRPAVGGPRDDRRVALVGSPCVERSVNRASSNSVVCRTRRSPTWSRRSHGVGQTRTLLKLTDGAGGTRSTELMGALVRSGSLNMTNARVVEVNSRPVPDSLVAAIAHRLDFLLTEIHTMLQAAALLGVEFEVS
jgi:hypothetical protein